MKTKINTTFFLIYTIILSFPLLLNGQSLFLGDIFIPEHHGINEEVQVYCTFIPSQNEELIKAELILPDNAKFISGDSTWSGNALRGQFMHFLSNIIFTDTGNFKLQLAVQKNYSIDRWAGNSFSYNLYVGLDYGFKGWKRYYNETERKLIKLDSAGFFEMKIYDDSFSKDSIIEKSN